MARRGSEWLDSGADDTTLSGGSRWSGRFETERTVRQRSRRFDEHEMDGSVRRGPDRRRESMSTTRVDADDWARPGSTKPVAARYSLQRSHFTQFARLLLSRPI